MQSDFKKLLDDLSRWNTILTAVKREYFEIMTRGELDIIGLIESKYLPPLFINLEKLANIREIEI